MIERMKGHLFWLAIGAVIFLMALGMSATDSKSLTNSFKVGKVNDVRTLTGKAVTTDISEQSKAIYLPERVISINIEDTHTKWRYMYMSIDKPQETIHCQLNYYKKSGELVYVQRGVRLDSVFNKIDLPTGVEYKYMHISFVTPEDLLLNIKNIQIREFEKTIITKRDVAVAIIVMIVYLLLYFMASNFCKKKNINLYKFIEVLQDMYISAGNALLWIPQKISLIKCKYFRSMLVFFLDVLHDVYG